MGKSSVINALTGQEISLVSDVSGTTTDPVYKAMEMLPLGPVVLIDTAGLNDTTELGHLRREKTLGVLDKTDVCLLVVNSTSQDLDFEREYMQLFGDKKIPTLLVINDFSTGQEGDFSSLHLPVVKVNPITRQGIDTLIRKIVEVAPKDEDISLTEGLIAPGQCALLVAPQDIQAPKGRLILPQVQVIRDLLDRHCLVHITTAKELPAMLLALKNPPHLVITDSQVFDYVDQTIHKSIPLTSFSILLSRQKGDIGVFVEGAKAIGHLRRGDKVLIVESCTHHAKKGDIAREKLPTWIDEYAGGGINFENITGDLPKDLSPYALIIHCGGCMSNRKAMLHKIRSAQQSAVPIANFGTAIAFLKGILNRICY